MQKVTRITDRRPGIVKLELSSGVRTLALDVGGTGVKAAILDENGNMIVNEVRTLTPHPCPPEVLLQLIDDLIAPFPSFDRVSVGFPGMVRDGCVITAPNLGTRPWHRFPLVAALSKRFDKPVRLLNDAEVQGLGVVSGHGLEFVVTLGTGMGTALFLEGRLAPHLELGHHPIRGKKTYDEYIGDKARHHCGKRRWSRRVVKALETLRALINYDVVYLGGGNAARLKGDLPKNSRIVDNAAGLTGGIRLWDHPTPVVEPSRRRHPPPCSSLTSPTPASPDRAPPASADTSARPSTGASS